MRSGVAVYRGVEQASKREVLLKRAHLTPALQVNQHACDLLLNEYRLIRVLDSLHLVQVREKYRSSDYLDIVYDCFPRHLGHRIADNSEISFVQVQKWAEQLLRGLLDLACAGLVHLNLRPSSCYFKSGNQDGELCIGNLESCENKGHRPTFISDEQWRYTAPEILKGHPATSKADIYSLGVILLDLAVEEPVSLLDLRTKRYKFLRTVPLEWQSLISDCLKVNVTARPSAFKLLQSIEIDDSGFVSSAMSEDLEIDFVDNVSKSTLERHALIQDLADFANCLVYAAATRPLENVEDFLFLAYEIEIKRLLTRATELQLNKNEESAHHCELLSQFLANCDYPLTTVPSKNNQMWVDYFLQLKELLPEARTREEYVSIAKLADIPGRFFNVKNLRDFIRLKNQAIDKI